MEEFIKENYYKLGSKGIARIYNCSQSRIVKLAKSLGVDTSISTVKILSRNKKQKDSYDRYSKILDFNTPKTAYLLGFMWADGHLGSSSFTCSVTRRDSSHIESIFKDYNFVKKDFISTINNNSYEMTRFSIYNKDIISNLSKLGFKTKTFIPPNEIKSILSDENFKYFICGFFDGDGHVGYVPYKHRIVNFSFDSRGDSSLFEDYLSNFFKIFIRKGIGNSKSIVISRKLDVIKFYEIFIKNCEYSMNRKKNVFESIANETKRSRENIYRRSLRAVYPDGHEENFNSPTDASKSLGINRSVINSALYSGLKIKGITFLDTRSKKVFRTNEGETFEALSNDNEDYVWKITKTRPVKVLRDCIKELI